MFCDELEGWEEGTGGRKAQETGDICVQTADSCCAAEANTTL